MLKPSKPHFYFELFFLDDSSSDEEEESDESDVNEELKALEYSKDDGFAVSDLLNEATFQSDKYTQVTIFFLICSFENNSSIYFS